MIFFLFYAIFAIVKFFSFYRPFLFQFNSSSTSDVISKLENIFRDHRKEVFGEDLADIISMMTELPDRMFNEMESLTSAAKWSSVKTGVDIVMSVVDRIVELEDTWQDIDKVRHFK